jgi:hypothetical protein
MQAGFRLIESSARKGSEDKCGENRKEEITRIPTLRWKDNINIVLKIAWERVNCVMWFGIGEGQAVVNRILRFGLLKMWGTC